MAKDRIEKTLVVFDEQEVREILELALRGAKDEIEQYVLKVFVKKVEAVLRLRCG